MPKKVRLISTTKPLPTDEDDSLDQTNDFTSGCSPYKRAAIKAVNKTITKKTAKKLKLSKSTVQCSSDADTDVSNSTKEESNENNLSKACVFCLKFVPISSFSNHLSECMKRNFCHQKDKAKEVQSFDQLKCNLCGIDIAALSESEVTNHLKNCLESQNDSSCANSKSISISNPENAVNNLLSESSSDSCSICRKYIGDLSISDRVLHKNQCVDQKEETVSFERRKAEALERAKHKVLDCPICGKPLKSQQGRKLHFKKCCETYQITADVLAERIKQQQEEYQLLLVAGEIPLDLKTVSEPGTRKPVKRSAKGSANSKKSGKNSTSTSDVNNRSCVHVASKFQEDTQLAIALSSSEVDLTNFNFSDTKNVEEPSTHSNALNELNALTIDKNVAKNVFALLMSPKASENQAGGKKRRKKVKIDINKLPLLMQTTEEMNRKLENKIADLVLNQPTSEFTTPPQFNKSNLITKYRCHQQQSKDEDSEITLWSKSHIMSKKCNTLGIFYVTELMPPISQCTIAAGSKLKLLSSIAGYQDDQHSREPQNPLMADDARNEESVTDITPSQTVHVLAELAQEHGSTTIMQQPDETCSLNQTGFLEPTSNEKWQGELESQALDCFAGMINHKESSDLKIKVAHTEQYLYCHSIFLSARCPSLAKEVSLGKIDLSLYSGESVLALLKFIYSGRIECEDQIYFELKSISERYNLLDLEAACNRIINDRNIVEIPTENAESSTLLNGNAFNPDKTLQNILKQAWGSDSEDSSNEDSEDELIKDKDVKTDANSENSNAEANRIQVSDDEELEDLYEFIDTQRTNQKHLQNDYNPQEIECSKQTEDGRESSRSSSSNSDDDSIEQFSDVEKNDLNLVKVENSNGIQLKKYSVDTSFKGHSQSQQHEVVGNNINLVASKEEISIPIRNMSRNELFDIEKDAEKCDSMTQVREKTISTDSKSTSIYRKSESDSVVESYSFKQNESNSHKSQNIVRTPHTTPVKCDSDLYIIDTASTQQTKVIDSKSTQHSKLFASLDSTSSESENEAPMDFTSHGINKNDVPIAAGGSKSDFRSMDDGTAADEESDEELQVQKESIFDSQLDEEDILAVLNESDNSFPTIEIKKKVSNSNPDKKSHNDKKALDQNKNLDTISVGSRSSDKCNEVVLSSSGECTTNAQEITKLHSLSQSSEHLNDSNDDLFDSLSDNNVSVQSGLNTKSSEDQIVTEALVENVVENEMYISDVASTPSPVFKSQNPTKSRRSGLDIENKSKYVINLSPQLKTDIESALEKSHCSKRKRDNSNEEFSNCSASKFRKTSSPKKSPRLRTTEDCEIDCDKKLTENNESSNLNNDSVLCSSQPIEQLFEADPCIDLTLSEDEEHEEDNCNPSDVEKPGISTVDAQVGVPEPEVSANNSIEKTDPHTSYNNGEVEDIWEDFNFDDAGFNQDLFNAEDEIKQGDKNESYNATPSKKATKEINISKATGLDDLDANDSSAYDPPTDMSMNVTGGDLNDESIPSSSHFTPPANLNLKKNSKTKRKPLSEWQPPSPFTPMAQYDNMDTPQLKKKVKTYGIRALPKKKMIMVLKNIYQETHTYETDPEFDEEEIKKFRETLASEVPQAETINAPSGKNKAKPKSRKIPKKNGKNMLDNELNDGGSCSSANAQSNISKKNGIHTVSTDSSEESSLNDSFTLPEESIIDSQQEEDNEPKLSKRDVEYKRQQLWNYVLKNEELQLKILHYEPIELSEFQQQVKNKGLKNIGTSIIAEFLDDKNIPFTNRCTNKATFGRKKVKKK